MAPAMPRNEAAERYSPLMAEAAAAMRDVLANVEFREPTAALLANADARPILTVFDTVSPGSLIGGCLMAFVLVFLIFSRVFPTLPLPAPESH